MRNSLLKVTRTVRVNHGAQRVEVLNAAGRMIWSFDAVALAVEYFSMTQEQFYATHMFLWVPCEPFASAALARLGGCRA